MKKIITRVIVSVLCLIILIIVVLLYFSPGQIETIKNKSGETKKNSISEIKRKDIGGIKQGMIIRGENTSKPILLFLHGGPGTTEYIPIKNSDLNLEKLFTVCYWEQRGSGMTYAATDSETITVDQMVSDTIEVAQYLRKRFKKKKIYIMGHSWGTFLGLQAVTKRPDLFHAYIGTGQMKCALEGEKRVAKRMVEEAERMGRKDLVKEMKNTSLYKKSELSNQYFLTKEKLRTNLKLIPDKVNSTSLMEDFMNLISSKEYTLKEKYHYIRGSMIDGKNEGLFKEFIKRDLATEVPKVHIPIFFLQGKYDDQTPYSLARDYYELLEAPKKKFYTFNKSAHDPMYEESKKFMNVLDDILKNSSP